MDYKAKYTFTKNKNGQLIGQSIDGMNTFIMPIDLESEDIRKKMFKYFLQKSMADVKKGQIIVEPTGEIKVNSDYFNKMIQSFADVDEHVALAIADYVSMNKLYGCNNEHFALLEAMDGSTIDDLALINKWILFYEYSIDSVEKVHKTCKEAVKIYKDKESKLPKALEMVKNEAEKAKIDFETIVAKENQGFSLTDDEKRRKQRAAARFVDCGNRYKLLINNQNAFLKLMRSRIEYIEWFANNADIAIASMENVKAVLELAKSTEIKDLLGIISGINEVITKIDTGCGLLPSIDSSEVNEENLQEFAEIMGMTFNDIPNLMAAAKEDLEKISKTRKDLESRNNEKTSSLNTNFR